MLKINERVDKDKVLDISKSFANIERMNSLGNDKEARSARVALHYITLANQIAAKMMNSSNTEFVLVSSCGIRISVPMGKAKSKKYLIIKSNKVWVTDQDPSLRMKKATVTQ